MSPPAPAAVRDRLRIAIQKSGRLGEPSRALLASCGLDWRESRDRLFCYGESLPVDLLLVRDDDIPGMLAEGVCDLGIVGRNVLAEQAAEREARGLPEAARELALRTLDWVEQAQALGAGEIVLNCIASDGVRSGFDIPQLQAVRGTCRVPLVASGGAGAAAHFVDVFEQADVDGALAASVFHTGALTVRGLKQVLRGQGIEVRDE